MSEAAGKDVEARCDVERRFARHRASLDLLSVGVAATDPREFLIRFAELSRSIIGADAVLVWLANKTTGRYELITLPGPETQLASPASAHWLDEETVRGMRSDVGSIPPYKLPWVSPTKLRLGAVLRAFSQTAGVIEVQFSESPCQTCEGWAALTADFVRHASRALESVHRSQMVRSLNDALSRVAEAETVDDLEVSLLAGAFNITGCEIGAVLRLDKETGGLDIARCQPIVNTNAQLSMDAGVTGQSLRGLKPVRLGDIRTHKYFKEYWPNIRSELAIPMS